MTLTTLAIVSLLALAPAAAKQGSCPQWEPMLRKYGLPVADFSYVMWRESRCLSSVVNHGKSSRDQVGLLQISASWSTVTKQQCRTTKRPEIALLSPTCNLKVASYLYANGGLAHWKATAPKKKD